MWKRVMFGVLGVLAIQESYTIWQKSRFVYFCIEYCNCLQHVNELDR